MRSIEEVTTEHRTEVTYHTPSQSSILDQASRYLQESHRTTVGFSLPLLEDIEELRTMHKSEKYITYKFSDIYIEKCVELFTEGVFDRSLSAYEDTYLYDEKLKIYNEEINRNLPISEIKTAIEQDKIPNEDKVRKTKRDKLLDSLSRERTRRADIVAIKCMSDRTREDRLSQQGKGTSSIPGRIAEIQKISDASIHELESYLAKILLRIPMDTTESLVPIEKMIIQQHSPAKKNSTSTLGKATILSVMAALGGCIYLHMNGEDEDNISSPLSSPGGKKDTSIHNLLELENKHIEQKIYELRQMFSDKTLQITPEQDILGLAGEITKYIPYGTKNSLDHTTQVITVFGQRYPNSPEEILGKIKIHPEIIQRYEEGIEKKYLEDKKELLTELQYFPRDIQALQITTGFLTRGYIATMGARGKNHIRISKGAKNWDIYIR